ncbi:O-acyltransferase like protein-like isoform X2 [Chironomus tepperi]|uniref:O-acyltransferase like protein-like isoform X2 n=1 Tax=Chironomus tepperi TaxID=113505 RepID=UPI00391F567C
MSLSDSLCKSQLNYIQNALKSQESWATRLFDFSTRLPAEILYQNTRRYSLFAECLEFRHETFSVGTIQGQYWAVSGESLNGGPKFVNVEYGRRDFDSTKTNTKVKFETGLCIPATCDKDDVNIFTDSVLSDVNLVAKRIFSDRSQAVNVSVLDYLVIFFFAALLLLVAVGTFYEIKSRSKRKNRRSLLTSFSLYTNIKELFKIDYSHSQKSIECLNGLRSIAAIWVIISHRLSRATDDPNFFLTRPMEEINFLYEMIWHTSIPVDVFIFVSALLATQSCLVAFEKHKLNYLKLCIHRYMRYMPSVLVLMLFIISFVPYLIISGPSINVLNEQVERCQNYWWSTLFMVQNYANVGGSCIPPAWYLCVDYQLYIISPILVYVVWKFGFKSFWGLGLLMFVTQSYLFYMRFTNSVTNHDVYTKTHFRFGQWITGIIFGYLMYKIENSSPKFEISKRTRRIIWILIAISLVLSQNSYKSFISILPDAFYQAIQDILFMCFLGWSIIAFHCYRTGNIFRWFLSHPFWQPFAKLTLSTFLVHDIYIFMSIANTKTLEHYSFGLMVLLFIKDILISTTLGAILYLCVEIPAAKVSNYFLNNNNHNNVDNRTDVLDVHRC